MLFSLIAPFYDRFMNLVGMDYSSRMVEWLSPVEGKDLLDLGGGTGINAGVLAGAGARVTIADWSQSMLARAGAKGLKARLVRADAAALPFSDNSFDIVLISDAWHHFRGQYRVIGEIARVLRQGGRLYVIDFDRSKIRTLYLIVGERLLGEPSTFWTPEDLAAAFKAKDIRGEFEYLTSNQFIYRGKKVC